MVNGVAFSNSKDPWSLVGPGCHQVSNGVVVRIVEGKWRVEDFFNTDFHSLCMCVTLRLPLLDSETGTNPVK